MLLRFSPLLLLLCAVGCSGPTSTYEVEIINYTKTLLSAGLVKPLPEREPGWFGPEHYLIDSPSAAMKRWEYLAKPGGWVAFVPTNASFSEGGYVRVYASDGRLEELAAISSGSPDRLDIPVFPGKSAFAITEEAGRLVAKPAPYRPPPRVVPPTQRPK